MNELLPVMHPMLPAELIREMAKTWTTLHPYQKVDLTAAQTQGWFPPVQTVVFPETPTEALNLKGVNENHDNSH